MISLTRLYVLRATYLLIVLGLGSDIWPVIIQHEKAWSLMHGVALSLLGAMSVLAALGIRYPLQMLPLLLFELLWKSIWLAVVALPLWSAGTIDAGTRETVKACLLGLVLFPAVIPWGYVWANYVRRPADRWGQAAGVKRMA